VHRPGHRQAVGQVGGGDGAEAGADHIELHRPQLLGQGRHQGADILGMLGGAAVVGTARLPLVCGAVHQHGHHRGVVEVAAGTGDEVALHLVLRRAVLFLEVEDTGAADEQQGHMVGIGARTLADQATDLGAARQRHIDHALLQAIAGALGLGEGVRGGEQRQGGGNQDRQTHFKPQTRVMA